ncbi:MAG: MerR family transcriptional regulator [Cellulosilyticaceae bacterium]
MTTIKTYYKIGEISKIYGIGKDSLMYYEELGILKPLRDANGYRLYKLSDIWRLNLIKELRSLEFSMKKIKDYLDNRTLSSTQEVLQEEVTLLDKKIAELLEYRQNIHKRLAAIQEVVCDEAFEKIHLQEFGARKALMLTANITRDEDVDFLIQKLLKEYEERFYILGNNNIGAVFNSEAFDEGNYTVFQSVFCLLEEQEAVYNVVIPAGTYMSVVYRGSYKNNRQIIPRMIARIEELGYKMIGDPIEIYKIDVHETGLEEEFVTEIQIPISVQTV